MSDELIDQFVFPDEFTKPDEFVKAWDYRGHAVRIDAEYILWRLRGECGWLTPEFHSPAFVQDWGDAKVFKGHELEKLNMIQWAAVRLDDAEAIKLCCGTGPE